jgi:hypothetical protein
VVVKIVVEICIRLSVLILLECSKVVLGLSAAIVYAGIYKETPWPLVRERTIPTDRPPLVDEI